METLSGMPERSPASGRTVRDPVAVISRLIGVVGFGFIGIGGALHSGRWDRVISALSPYFIVVAILMGVLWLFMTVGLSRVRRLAIGRSPGFALATYQTEEFSEWYYRLDPNREDAPASYPVWVATPAGFSLWRAYPGVRPIVSVPWASVERIEITEFQQRTRLSRGLLAVVRINERVARVPLVILGGGLMGLFPLSEKRLTQAVQAMERWKARQREDDPGTRRSTDRG